MRVLIVEDEVLVRTDLAQWLREAGYAVEEAPNGRAGLDRMRREVPDVVLLDLRMPIMDGYEFNIERLKDPALSKVPIIRHIGRGHPIGPACGDERQRFPVAVRNLRDQTLTHRRTAIEARHLPSSPRFRR
jgi:hypothetical protein